MWCFDLLGFVGTPTRAVAVARCYVLKGAGDPFDLSEFLNSYPRRHGRGMGHRGQRGNRVESDPSLLSLPTDNEPVSYPPPEWTRMSGCGNPRDRCWHLSFAFFQRCQRYRCGQAGRASWVAIYWSFQESTAKASAE